jgi:hypothetical protein
MKAVCNKIITFVIMLLAFVASIPRLYVQNAVKARLFAPATARSWAMTALSADRETTRKEAGFKAYPVAATTTIYKGSLVCLNSSGYAIPAADTAGLRFIGVASEKVVNASGNGAANINVYTEGLFKFVATSISQAMVGDPMYAADDQTFDDTSTNLVQCGVLDEYVSATSGWINIGSAVKGKVVASQIADDAVTVDKIPDGEITAVKLADGAGVAALLAAGLGASEVYAKTTDGAQTLLAADAEDARAVLIVVTVTQAFANGTGAQTVFTISETDTANKFMANSVLVGASLGDVFVFAGSLTATKALLVTGTAATGTGTGAIAVTALALPAES